MDRILSLTAGVLLAAAPLCTALVAGVDREPLGGVRPAPVGQIVALSGSECVYACHQWCRHIDMASDQYVVLVLAGGGGCRTYCGACRWTVW